MGWHIIGVDAVVAVVAQPSAWLRMCSNKQAVIERKPHADPKTANIKEDPDTSHRTFLVLGYSVQSHKVPDIACFCLTSSHAL